MRNYSIRLEDDLHLEIMKYAVRFNLTMSEAIRSLISNGLEHD